MSSKDSGGGALPRLSARILLQTLHESVEEVFTAMVDIHAQCLIEVDQPDHETGKASALDIEAIVGFHGSIDGYVVLRCSHGGALALARALLMADPMEELDSEEVSDALGECANMIAGSVKTKALDPLQPFELGLPEVHSPVTSKPGYRPGACVCELADNALAAEIWLEQELE